MTYRVILAKEFRDDIAEHVRYLRDEHVADDVIEGWYERLFSRFDMLDVWPRMYPVDEARTAAIGVVNHKINHQDHVVFYQVDDELKRVEITTLLHGATRK